MSTRHVRRLFAGLIVCSTVLLALVPLSGCSGSPKPAAPAANDNPAITTDAVAVIARTAKTGNRTDSTILEVPVMTGEANVLLDVVGAVDGVQLSTGGGRMSYVEAGKLWMVFGAGARPKLIADNVIGRGVWSLAKPHLAYVSSTASSKKNTAYVYDAPRDTRTALDLTELGGLTSQVVGWSADGSAIFISAGPASVAYDPWQLFRVEVATGRVSKIGEKMGFVGFDAKGTLIIARLLKAATWQLESVAANGTAARLIDRTLPTNRAAISVDGKQLAFGALDDFGSTQLFLWEIDGAVPQPVTTLVGATEITPVWSGDNRTVVLSWRDEKGAVRMSVCDVKTRVTRDLLSTPGPDGTSLTPVFGVAP